ncbi:PadR family transcriptional regulator [Amycolatopsis suaedae]|uniref:PadR family transcriptional regulator n=2 Tax=Amycolatopsis suaedae TaxID=2510978 RepID=A0A4Q7JC78_9PSEU|nr:PadR family transcriptional regulator [Amycolatopsis suaedae]
MERPMHPYELGKLLKQRDKNNSIRYRHASLYMVVEQLHRDGSIEAQETVRDGQRPERTVYRLTDAGRAELRERMRELVSVPVKEYPQFEAALALIIVLPPDEVAELLRQRHDALTERAEQLRTFVREATDSADVDGLFLIEHDYRLELIDAERRFLDRFRERILAGDPDFGRFWRQLHQDRQAR